MKAQYEKGENLNKQLKGQYEKSLSEIGKNIADFYMRFAKDNNMTYVDAIKQLTSSEYNRWRKSIDKYIEELERMADIEGSESNGFKELLLELNTLAMKSRINRLEGLMMNIQLELADLYQKEHVQVTGLLKDVADDVYYQTIYDVQVGRGIGHSFNKLDSKTVEDIMSYPWSGDNYSKRIWKQRDKLADTIKQELTQKFIQGKDVRTTAKSVADKMNVSYKNACALVETETTYIAGQTTLKGYKAMGMEQYQYLATLDSRTSELCRDEDEKVFNIDDAVVGVNYPPLHVHCRSTTIPYFDDEKGERAARGVDGKTYYVPGDMTYKDWYNRYVKNNADSDAVKEKDFKYPEIKTIKDAKKALINEVGFTEVEDSFMENVDPELIIKNTRQLKKLENKYGIIHSSTNTTICSVDRGDAVAYVSNSATNPTRQNLSLCPNSYNNINKLISYEKISTEKGQVMPKALTDEELSIGTVTHEYGHMLQNKLIEDEMRANGWTPDKPMQFINTKKKSTKAVLKWYTNIETKVKKRCFDEIVDIAKKNNPNFDLDTNISRYGRENYKEFFAETFMNAELSKPNELGLAMRKWLKLKK